MVNSFIDFWSRWDILSAWTFIILLFALVFLRGVITIGIKSSWRTINWWRVASALAFFVVIFVALSGPFEALSGELLWAHMVQHMLIIFGSPLILLANPIAHYLWGSPKPLRAGIAEASRRGSGIYRVLRLVTNPKISLPIFVLTLWAWHYPPLYVAALENGIVHNIEHLTMFFASMIFWWPLIGPAPMRITLREPLKVLYLILVITPSALLGAIITFSGSVLYDYYEAAPMHFGLSPLGDQAIAGTVLWTIGNAGYLIAFIVIVRRWVAKDFAASR